MGRCRFRPLGYRIGLGFVGLGFVLVAMGYGFPTWIRRSRRWTQGVWYMCEMQWSSCIFLGNENVLLVAVRALMGTCLLLYLASFTMALRENCCSPNFYTCCLAGRKTEVFAFLAELLGISGMLLFSIDEYETVGNFNRLSWAHAVCDFGLAVSLTGSIMMACSQQSLPAAKAAAGRIVAKPQGYQSLASNHRSSSLQSRTTHYSQNSPFQGRNTPRVSGPFPSPAAIAAVTAAVSPKQQRMGMSSASTSPQLRKLSGPGPYPPLDSQSSPSRRRMSSAHSRQFAGVHQQGKHPQLVSQRLQDEWRMQQSATWSEDMRVEDSTLRKQMALRSPAEQQNLQHHANTWSVANERKRSWAHSVHTEQHYFNRSYRSTSLSEEYNPPQSTMPRPSVPPSSTVTSFHGSPIREAYQSHPPAEFKHPQVGNPQYPGPGYATHINGRWRNSPSQQHFYQKQQPPQPDADIFPDPPPPEQLLCYEEERPTDTSSYHGYPNPIPGDMMPSSPKVVQPVVMYRTLSQPGESPFTETVTIEPLDFSRHSRSSTPHGSPHLVPSYQRHSLQHHVQHQQHQTFPRQQPSHFPVSHHAYNTFER